MTDTAQATGAQVAVTAANRVRRAHERGRYDRDFIYQVLDQSVLCHLGFVDDGQPVVTPTIHWRDGDWVYWHGANAARYIKASANALVCMTVTHLDGLVLARSAFHHSANYRSVMIQGQAQAVLNDDHKAAALEAMIEKIFPGRWDLLRPMNEGEFAGTTVIRMPIEIASAKSRTGGPIDDEEDYALPIWAGTVPIYTTFGAVEVDHRLLDNVPQPDHVNNLKDRLG
ncbi:MAG: pyridoxamine 5'-phosphate oxidase family protein [Pseudomonadales bacterium]